MRIKEIWPKQVPGLVDSCVAWLSRKDREGAAFMMSHLLGGDVDIKPDDVARRLAAVQVARTALSINAADMYAVTGRKTVDVIHAGHQLPYDMEVRREYFNSDHGFMVFERGFNTLLRDNLPRMMDGGVHTIQHEKAWEMVVPIYAISWRIFGGSIHVFAWTCTHRYVRDINRLSEYRPLPEKDLARRTEVVGPLIMCGDRVVKIASYMKAVESVQSVADQDYLSPLLAACLMLKQSITAKSIIDVPRPTLRYGQPPDMNQGRKVTVIDQRAIRPNPTNEDEPDREKRQLHVRYDVRGHWREYKNPRFSEDVRERPIWIPHHWVGNEALPMVNRDKVTRLKR